MTPIAARAAPGSGSIPTRTPRRLRRKLHDGAERVAVTSNESGATTDDDEWPAGHRDGPPAGDDDVRDAGENR